MSKQKITIPLRGVMLKAIELFWKIQKYEDNISRLQNELDNLVTKIPDQLMEEYISKTEVKN